MAVPSVEVSPKVGLVDEKICIRAVTLRPSQEVTLQAWVSERGAVYTSCGHFVADGQGCVDTTQHSSLGGTYTGVDAMGLFWSLKVVKGLSKTTRLMKADVTTPLVFDIRVLNGHVGFDDLPHTSDSVLASTTCERWYKHQSVRRVVVREGKLRGTLFIPPGDGPFPGVIDMFGTAGGLIEIRAALLASRGFACFALAYFAYEDLPKLVEDFDLRYFLDAVDWFSSHPSVHPGGVGLVGVSKGGELGFVLASVTDKIKALVNINGVLSLIHEDLKKDGKPFLKALKLKASGVKFTEERLVTHNCLCMEDMVFTEVWRNNAKVLCLFGDDDGTWDTRRISSYFYSSVPEKYKKNIKVINYPDAGHLLEPPYMPVCRSSYSRVAGSLMYWGGYPKAHAIAQEDAWKRLLKFLHQALDIIPAKSLNSHL